MKESFYSCLFKIDLQTTSRNCEEGELIIKKPICKARQFGSFEAKINMANNQSFGMNFQNKENLTPKINNFHTYSKNHQKKLELLEKNNKKTSCSSLNFKRPIEKGLYKSRIFY